MTKASTDKNESGPRFVRREIPPEYIVKMDSAEFIRLGGLLYLAGQQGVFRCQTKDVSLPDTEEIIYECTGWIVPSDKYLEEVGISKDSPFASMLSTPVVMHGTANSDNLKSRMFPFRTVMAETRSISRCLRILTGCPMTAVEELGNYNFNAEDVINTARSAGIDLVSAADVLNETQKEPKTRAEYIKAINSLDIPGVKDIVKRFLDEHNALILENLSEPLLRELYNGIIQYAAE